MAEFNDNLWAPWRMEYIRSLAEQEKKTGCFLCHYSDHPEEDGTNLVIWRGKSAFVCMNRFPYTTGHLLVAHAGHKGSLADLTPEELTEMTGMLRDGTGLLAKTVHAEGFNVGYNIGLCAGAGLPGHLHAHIVPRWNGDTNFMPVLGDVRVVPEALHKLRDQLVSTAIEMGLRD